MKLLKIIGLFTSVLFALGAVLACSASAVEGLLPAVGLPFNVLAKTAILETANKEAITCGETKGEGSFSKLEDTHGSATLDFLKCEIAGFPAFSLGEKEPKEIKEALILVPVLLLICLLNAAELEFGIFTELINSVHVHVKALGILVNVTGSVIGALLTGKGKLILTDFTGKAGKPTFTECKDEAGNVKKASLKSERDPAGALTASLSAEGALLQLNQEAELMD